MHPEILCLDEYCPLHNPSDHPLRDAPINIRPHVLERICAHGIGHPDPDDAAWRLRTFRLMLADGTHGCDGCCQLPSR